MSSTVATERREQGSTRRDILQLLRRQGSMTATELSAALGIGAVGVRQHLGLLERDGMVRTVGVRRGVGRPSYLYALTPTAEELFPRSYDVLVLDLLDYISSTGGPGAVAEAFERRRRTLLERYGPHMEGKSPSERIEVLERLLNDRGYMTEIEHEPDGSVVFTEHNCPIDCVARQHPEACEAEIRLYEELLGAPIEREGVLAHGDPACRYRIKL